MSHAPAPPGVMAYLTPERLPETRHEQDEHAWLHEQADLLRAGRLAEIDRAPLAEYLTDMAWRDEREMQSRFAVLLQHLLKATCQPEKLSDSWVDTIDVQQVELREILESRSLRAKAPGIMGRRGRLPAGKPSATPSCPTAPSRLTTHGRLRKR